MPLSPKPPDQASALRQLMAEMRAPSSIGTTTVAVVGATIQSGATRLALQLQRLADLQLRENGTSFRFVAMAPEEAFGKAILHNSGCRLLVVSPDEEDVVAGFAALKLAARAGLLDQSLGLVANRCEHPRDAMFVHGTLGTVSQRHLDFRPNWLLALGERDDVPGCHTVQELLASCLQAIADNHLAARGQGPL